MRSSRWVFWGRRPPHGGLTMECCHSPPCVCVCVCVCVCACVHDCQASETPAVQPHHALVYPLRPDLQLEIAKRYARSVQETVAALGLTPFEHSIEAASGAPFDDATGSPQQALRRWLLSPRLTRVCPDAGRIRIGYVSSDLCDHPLCHLLVNALCWHDASRFDVFMYVMAECFLPAGRVVDFRSHPARCCYHCQLRHKPQ